ncbi:hypothetical protein L596_026071 [Steinernema carpocapsae]|uniref:G-protein coupled receptors family 1 profile domain-containing protein n=1 Tax=Steinernema carpocapsae TaxID=34508 RepID=A0A4U5M0A3_STECR|nr:hypothetical protein L596_026071 [Steinernema carpocapsae]
MSSIHRYFSHKLHGNQHLTLLTVKVIFDAFFALVAWIYSVLMILKLEGQITSNEYAFLLGNLTFSLELSMGVLSVFIALDRLLSMRRPFEYGQIYSPIILKLALCSMFFAFLTAFTVYYITRKADISQGYMFYQFADYTAQTYVHLTMSTAFLLNILITFVVIFDFRRFMTTGVQSYMVTYVKKLAFANRIVRYQMVADLVTLIVPNLAIPVLKYGFGFDLVARVGPITPPLFSLYVAFCAMLFRFVAAKK